MEPSTYYQIGVIVGTVLALANAGLGAYYIKQGERERGAKYFTIGGVMLLLALGILVTRGV